MIVWTLILFVSTNSTPAVIDNIASRAACERLQVELRNSPRKLVSVCVPVEKAK